MSPNFAQEGVRALAQPSLRETAYRTIKGWIGTDRLPGGSVTSEIKLSELLNMSRTPVRAALQQLETEDFLRIVPKHGVLILHSSAERVGDLLETLIAIVLFAFERNKTTKAGEIAGIANSFMIPPPEEVTPERICAMEADMWGRLIALGQNREMIRMWQNAAERVHWPHNHRRWKPPYRAETEHCLGRLLSAMASQGQTAPDFFPYLHMLKKTWS